VIGGPSIVDGFVFQKPRRMRLPPAPPLPSSLSSPLVSPIPSRQPRPSWCSVDSGVTMFVVALLGGKFVRRLGDRWLRRIYLAAVWLLGLKTLIDVFNAQEGPV
jgi:hypothetical protein